jgi:hypothetical protein
VYRHAAEEKKISSCQMEVERQKFQDQAPVKGTQHKEQ